MMARNMRILFALTFALSFGQPVLASSFCSRLLETFSLRPSEAEVEQAVNPKLTSVAQAEDYFAKQTGGGHSEILNVVSKDHLDVPFANFTKWGGGDIHHGESYAYAEVSPDLKNINQLTFRGDGGADTLPDVEANVKLVFEKGFSKAGIHRDVYRHQADPNETSPIAKFQPFASYSCADSQFISVTKLLSVAKGFMMKVNRGFQGQYGIVYIIDTAGAEVLDNPAQRPEEGEVLFSLHVAANRVLGAMVYDAGKNAGLRGQILAH